MRARWTVCEKPRTMTEKIGIIGAMKVEIATIVAQLEDHREAMVAGSDFHEGLLDGRPVVVARCGVGKVNAAMCTQIVIGRFGATQVINTGVAGALDPTLDIGDLVISTDAVQYDMVVTGLGYEPGVIPELGVLAFTASEELRAVMHQAAREVLPDITIVDGRVASGDRFVCDRDENRRIAETFDASCCEMEGAAIGQVAWINKIPFVVVRSISDKADGSDVIDYPEFELKSAERSAALVVEMLKTLR